MAFEVYSVPLSLTIEAGHGPADYLVKLARDLAARERGVRYQGQALAGAVVDHRDSAPVNFSSR